MHCAIIIWSQRSSSQSSKVWLFCKKILTSLSISSDIIDLWVDHLPYWDELHNPNSELGIEAWEKHSKILQESDWVIVISPERWGMVPWVLKNFFLWCKKWELAHKPWLIVWVSAGTGWAYPIVELRMSSYKNTKICYIPDHVIVRHVDQVLNDNTEEDKRVELRIENSIKTLQAYMQWFAIIRQEQIIKDNPMSNGM